MEGHTSQIVGQNKLKVHLLASSCYVTYLQDIQRTSCLFPCSCPSVGRQLKGTLGPIMMICRAQSKAHSASSIGSKGQFAIDKAKNLGTK